MIAHNRVSRRRLRQFLSLLLTALALVGARLAAAATKGDDAAALDAALQLGHRAEATTDGDQRQELWGRFLADSAPLARVHPEQTAVWLLRAAAALDLNQARPAREAAQRLLAVAAPDERTRAMLGRLKQRGWTALPKIRTLLPPGPPPPPQWAGRPVKAGVTEIKLRWIAPGTFQMGSSAAEPRGRPVHLTRGYWLGETEVTQAQWEGFIGVNPSNFQQDQRLREEKAMTIIGDDRPVEQVSWKQAMEFCHRLTALEQAAGRVPPGYEYRLPTEAEWEYAARAGAAGDYSGNLDRFAWYDGNAHDATHDVAGKKSNAWGLSDMAGNVAEWCYDWYQNLDDNEVTDWAVLDPDPDEPTDATRVIRGGSWLTVAARCQPSYRVSDDPGNTVSYVGFRLALAPSVNGK